MANQAVKIDGVWQILRIAGWCFVVLLLLLPAVAMQFTSEVDWSVGDFIVMGAVLGTVGFTTEFLVRQSGSTAYRIGAVVAMATAFLTIWVNLAVGMIGDEGNPANLMYLFVLFVALVGASIGRFEPREASITMFAAAGAQVVVAGIALVAGLGPELRADAFFVAAWVTSGLLFRQAGIEPSPTSNTANQ